MIWVCTVCIGYFVRHFGVTNFRTFTIIFMLRQLKIVTELYQLYSYHFWAILVYIKHILSVSSDFFICASRVPYSHFCFGTHILNLTESQDSQSYSGKFCNGRNDFLVGLTLYSPSESWDA